MPFDSHLPSHPASTDGDLSLARDSLATSPDRGTGHGPRIPVPEDALAPAVPHPSWDTALVLVVATAVLSAVAAGPSVVPGDVWLTDRLQGTRGPIAEGVAGFAHTLGSTVVLTAGSLMITALVAWRRHWRDAALIVAGGLTRIALPWLKVVFESPRPDADLVRVTEHARGNGFPSGHAMGVTLLAGMSAVLLPRYLSRPRDRAAFRAGAILLILVTGFGRVSTGAHWPTDVVGGYLWAASLGTVLIAVAYRGWPRRRTTR